MKNTNCSILFIIAFLLLSVPAFSQAQPSTETPADQTLKGQFQSMLDASESYTDYKVVRRTSLSQYSKAVEDSIKAYKTEISALKNTVSDQKSQIAQLGKRITDLEAQLAKSEELRESLSFMGINIQKATYHWIVWLIIAALAVFGIFIYTSFIRSNKVTSKTIKEYKAIEVEFEEHKKKSHEKQIKMGRELQTERNKVEELKTKMKAKTPGKP